MAVKKSQIYSTLWSACDALRGSMDASQYKDYVLILLFVKYLSDKESDPESLFEIPDGCRFNDFVALKGNKDIGEEINKKLELIKSENLDLLRKLAIPNFNDPNKLGSPKEMTDTLSKLVAVFEDSNLDFSQNRSADDDILGDAYEYLMKNFAQESGKSKGQFYTPAEVSRVMAKMLRLDEFTSRGTTIYDPTCGSGSLLLRAINETPNGATPFGQEKDNATASLAILNMLLHGMQMATIEQGDTLNHPQFTEGGTIRTFDICVANPPFSTKSWLGDAGVDDRYHRWNENLCPPAKCGDYAFLLHLIGSMKDQTGRGACILPHGVLFRGNAEYDIRKHIIERGYIEGIVGLPSNVFFGTGIPACILLINKAGAANRQGIFFIDAKEGFVKDGNKNRLREQDVKRIVDTWLARKDVPNYARFATLDEIRRNDYNLNIPRYVSPRDTEVLQDIEAHLHGGIPAHDIDRMAEYWAACPSLREALFAPIEGREGYCSLIPAKGEVSNAIYSNDGFKAQLQRYDDAANDWTLTTLHEMVNLNKGIHPKALIEKWSQHLLDTLNPKISNLKSLINPYDAYQQLMEYWADTLQDDCYMISRDGWMLIISSTKKNPTYLDLQCDLLPVSIVVDQFFRDEEHKISEARAESADYAARLSSLVDAAVEELDDEDEIKALKSKTSKLKSYKDIEKQKKAADKRVKELTAVLTDCVIAKYGQLNQDHAEVAQLVAHHKWMRSMGARLIEFSNRVTQNLASEVIAVADRYATPLPAIESRVAELEARVNSHLAKMGFSL